MATCIRCKFPIYKAERGNVKIAPNGFIHIDCEKALSKQHFVEEVKSKSKPEPKYEPKLSRKVKFLSEEEYEEEVTPYGDKSEE